MNNVLKLINWALNKALFLLLLFLIAVSAYSIWDNAQIYSQAESVQAELYQFKPAAVEGEEYSFEALREINPDVCAWLSVDGTNIDYPVLKGVDNLVYLNKDVYGNFALAGSIFMDVRSPSSFRSPYSLLYGHHMDNHLMFGDLDLFTEEEFFETNRSAVIVTDDEVINLEVLAVLVIPDNAKEIFDPAMWGADLTDLALYIQENATYIWDPAMEELLKNPTSTQAVSLATCASGTSGMRIVVILIAHRDYPVDDPTDPTTPESPDKPAPPPYTGDSILNEPILWGAIALVVFFLMGMLVGNNIGSPKKFRPFHLVLIIITLIVLGVSAAQLARIENAKRETETTYIALKAQIETTKKESEKITPEPTDAPLNEKFSQIRNEKPDFFGWISIDGTTIDYPVMDASQDEEFYLTHNYEGEKNPHGTPFTSGSRTLPDVGNVVVHGHNMRDGTMFASLHKFEDPAFCEAGHTITFDTIYEDGQWEVVSVFKISVEETEEFPYYLFTEINSAQAASDYLARCNHYALWHKEIQCADSTRFLTLSTCDKTYADGRLVVVAVKNK